MIKLAIEAMRQNLPIIIKDSAVFLWSQSVANKCLKTSIFLMKSKYRNTFGRLIGSMRIREIMNVHV